MIVSNQLRICTACDGPIDKDERYGFNPFGDVVCLNCHPVEDDDGEDLDLDNWSLGIDWDEDDDE